MPAGLRPPADSVNQVSTGLGTPHDSPGSANALARATTVSFLRTRVSRPRSQPPSGVELAANIGIADRVPCISSLHQYLLPPAYSPQLSPIDVVWNCLPEQAQCTDLG
jgi:hypothetical protein